MARPIKKGLDYFPLDITWKKGALEYLYCMYGILGAAVIKLSLEPRIYGGNGYFVEYNERSALIFSNEFGDQLSIVGTKDKKRHEIYDDIVKTAIEYGIFDSEMYKRYGILTSAEIQETYIRAKEKCQRVEIEKRYLLLSDVKIPKNVEVIEVYGEETHVINTKNDTKKSKVNKSINNNNIRAYRVYDEKSGFRTSTTAWEGITDYLNSGMSDDVICAVIEDAAETAERFSWRYVDSVLRDKQKKGIFTLSAYKRDKAEWERSRKRDSSPPANEPQYKPIVLELAKYRGERT